MKLSLNIINQLSNEIICRFVISWSDPKFKRHRYKKDYRNGRIFYKMLFIPRSSLAFNFLKVEK